MVTQRAVSVGDTLVPLFLPCAAGTEELLAEEVQRILGDEASGEVLRGGVLVVEHDLDAIRTADYMIELGPGSGEKGGHVVFAGESGISPGPARAVAAGPRPLRKRA